MHNRREGEESPRKSAEGFLGGGWFVNPELEVLKKSNHRLAEEKAALEEECQRLTKQIKQKAADEALLPEPLRAENERRIAAAKKIVELSKTIEEKERNNAARVIQKAGLKKLLRKRPENALSLAMMIEPFKLLQAKLKSEKEKYQLELEKYQSEVDDLMKQYDPLNGATDKDTLSERIIARQQAWEKEFLRHEEAMALLAVEKESLHEQLYPRLFKASRVFNGQLVLDTGLELVKLGEERATLQKELNIQASIPRKMLTLGGSRYLRYQMTPAKWVEINQDFFKAVTSLDIPKAQELFALGANVNMVDPKTGFGLLLSLIMSANGYKQPLIEKTMEMVKWLITQGANPDQRTTKDWTRDNINLVLNKGSTPLMALVYIWSAKHVIAEVADLLIEKGASIDAQNDSDITALHISTEFINNKDTVEYLTGKNARTDIKNKEDNTALVNYQKKTGKDVAIIQLLQKTPGPGLKS